MEKIVTILTPHRNERREKSTTFGAPEIRDLLRENGDGLSREDSPEKIEMRLVEDRPANAFPQLPPLPDG